MGVRNGSLVVTLVSAVALATLLSCSSSTRAHGSPLLPMANAVHEPMASQQQLQAEDRPEEATGDPAAAAQTAQLPADTSSSSSSPTSSSPSSSSSPQDDNAAAKLSDTTEETVAGATASAEDSTTEATRLASDTTTTQSTTGVAEKLVSLTTTTRLRRQVRSMDTTTLNNVCSLTSYHTEECYLYTRYLLDNRTEEARQCVANASPKVREVDQVTGKTSSRCNITREEKREARHQYCRIYDQINVMYSEIFRRLMKTYRDSDAVRAIYEDTDSGTSPQAVFEMISRWHEEIERYIGCTNLHEGDDELTDQDYADLGLNFRRRTECFSDSPVQCWDSLLVELAGYIKTTELLSELGNRRSKLVGCVSTKQVNCCDLQIEAALESKHLIPNLHGLLG